MQEGLDALADVIYHLETYDVTTMRASTPMYLMARRIRAMGIKMVLSGEGADEIFGGYLYFHKAPTAREFHEETVRKLDLLHKYDCLRANKAMAAWGVEARVPFLDRAVPRRRDVDRPRRPSAMRPGGIEKQILREAFDGVLPRRDPLAAEGAVLRRRRLRLDRLAEGLRRARDLRQRSAERALAFPYGPPQTKEAYLYRVLFAGAFPGEAAARCVPGGDSIACSTPAAIAWDPIVRRHGGPVGTAPCAESTGRR